MLEAAALVAFVATRDERRSRRFYETTLGLTVLADEPYALVFNANGTTFRVQKVDAFTPQPFTVLGWVVSSIDATVRSLADGGVEFERYPGMVQDGRGVWTAPSGARVAWFKDPDGNTLSLTQLQTTPAL